MSFHDGAPKIVIVHSGYDDTRLSSESQHPFEMFDNRMQQRIIVSTGMSPESFVGVRADCLDAIIIQFEFAVRQSCTVNRDIPEINTFCFLDWQ